MFCKKCGSELSNDDEFCSKCGTPVNNKFVTEEYDPLLELDQEENVEENVIWQEAPSEYDTIIIKSSQEEDQSESIIKEPIVNEPFEKVKKQESTIKENVAQGLRAAKATIANPIKPRKRIKPKTKNETLAPVEEVIIPETEQQQTEESEETIEPVTSTPQEVKITANELTEEVTTPEVETTVEQVPVEETSIIEETLVVEETPVVEEVPVVEQTPVAEEPVITESIIDNDEVVDIFDDFVVDDSFGIVDDSPGIVEETPVLNEVPTVEQTPVVEKTPEINNVTPTQTPIQQTIEAPTEQLNTNEVTPEQALFDETSEKVEKIEKIETPIQEPLIEKVSEDIIEQEPTTTTKEAAETQETDVFKELEEQLPEIEPVPQTPEEVKEPVKEIIESAETTQSKVQESDQVKKSAAVVGAAVAGAAVAGAAARAKKQSVEKIETKAETSTIIQSINDSKIDLADSKSVDDDKDQEIKSKFNTNLEDELEELDVDENINSLTSRITTMLLILLILIIAIVVATFLVQKMGL